MNGIMKVRRPTKNELDLLASRLIKTVTKKSDEFEEIVSKPGLYDGVLLRISEEGSGSHSVDRSLHSSKTLVASGAGAVLLLPLVSYLLLSGGQDLMRSDLPEIGFPASVAEPEPKLPMGKGPEALDKNVRAAGQNRPNKTSNFRKRKPVSINSAEPTEAKFYAIGITNGLEDAMIDGRVVRVDLPRSVLYAMGLDVPLENSIRPIQADLLVGPDGTPRAIRILD